MDCGEGGFWKIYFIALFYLYVNSGRRGIFARTEVRIMCLRRGGLRHWGYFERTHGANKCIYRQILNKK